MKSQGNFLAGATQPAAAPRQPTPAPAPYKAPVADGSNQGPMIGDRQKIYKPAAPQIASSPNRRENNDVNSGMSTAMGAMADQMHPVKRR